MAKDIEQQVIEEVKKSLYYAIQLDESTDVSNCAVLLWISREDEYPSLSFTALKLLVVFSTSYLCEKSFSALTLIKTKQKIAWMPSHNNVCQKTP